MCAVRWYFAWKRAHQFRFRRLWTTASNEQLVTWSAVVIELWWEHHGFWTATLASGSVTLSNRIFTNLTYARVEDNVRATAMRIAAMWLLSNLDSRHSCGNPFDYFPIRPERLTFARRVRLSIFKTNIHVHPSIHVNVYSGVANMRVRHSVMINPGPISGRDRGAYLARDATTTTTTAPIVCLLYFDRNAKCCGLVRRLGWFVCIFCVASRVDQKLIDTRDFPTAGRCFSCRDSRSVLYEINSNIPIMLLFIIYD